MIVDVGGNPRIAQRYSHTGRNRASSSSERSKMSFGERAKRHAETVREFAAEARTFTWKPN